MTTAICFTGTGRSLNYTFENLKDKLIDRNPNCHVFLHIAETKHAQKVTKHFSFDAVKRLVVEKDEQINVSGLNWQPEWPKGLFSGRDPKQTYLNMLLSRKKCGDLLSSYANENNIEYKKVIFSRLDIKYLYNIPRVLDLNSMCVADFHNFDMVQGAGCNDRFAASNFENMKTYFNLYDSIRGLVDQGHLLHGESTLHKHLSVNNINIKKYFIRFTRIRPNGNSQDDRLRAPDLLARAL